MDCDLLVLSYNDESWLELEELEAMCSVRRSGGGATPVPREVATLAFDSARYVGARIGIFDPSGKKVGRVGRLSNRELLVIAGEAAIVQEVVEAIESVAGSSGSSGHPAHPASGSSGSSGSSGHPQPAVHCIACLAPDPARRRMLRSP